ncbi:hypothetical protein LG314_03970 [Agrococcus terreus]|uniref:hypothetical protein n=1 Tax=Agrococcus terreus TaxID=574649 RepID=UPI00384C8756
MATTARIPNPVSGSVRGGGQRAPLTRRNVVALHAMGILACAYFLVIAAHGLEPPAWTWALALPAILVSGFGLGWGSQPRGWWPLAPFALVIALSLIWGLAHGIDEPLLLAGAALLALGGTLGAAVAHPFVARRVRALAGG